MKTTSTPYSNIVILLPGTTASTLVAKKGDYLGDQVWPREVVKDLAVHDIDGAKRAIEGDLFAGQPLPTEGKLASPYDAMIQSFVNAGYDYWIRDAVQSSAGKGKLLVGFSYDWRQDNFTTVSTDLAPFLTVLCNAGYLKEDTLLTFLGHSMGGLVMRNLIDLVKYQAPGKQQLITMGTPHLGAPLAFQAMIGELRKLFTFDAGSFLEDFVNDPKYTSTAELLPAPGIDFVFDPGNTNAFDIYSKPLMDHYQDWGGKSGQFTCAQDAWNAISKNTASDYHLIYAIENENGMQTNTSFTWDDSDTRPTPNYTVNAVNSDGTVAGGDSVVPYTSAVYGEDINADNVYKAQQPVNHDFIPTQKDVISHVMDIISAG